MLTSVSINLGVPARSLAGLGAIPKAVQFQRCSDTVNRYATTEESLLSAAYAIGSECMEGCVSREHDAAPVQALPRNAMISNTICLSSRDLSVHLIPESPLLLGFVARWYVRARTSRA